MNHRITGSRTDLAEKCVWWANTANEIPQDVAGQAADEGTRLHALAEELAENGFVSHEPESDIAARWQQLAPWIEAWRDHVPESERLIEAGYRYDVVTGSVADVPRNAGRAYGQSGTEIPFRLDLARVGSGPEDLTIWDIKTGETAPLASDAGQLKTAAVTLARKHGKTGAKVAIVHVRDSGVYVDEATLDMWDLETHAESLKKAVLSVENAKPFTGMHCRWCPARTVCPAISEAMVAAPSMAISGPEDVARVWPLLKPIEDALKAIQAKAREVVAEAGEVPLKNGKRLRIVRSGGGETVDPKALAIAVGAECMDRLRANGVIRPRASGSYIKEVNK